jgi:hypothetical protein
MKLTAGRCPDAYSGRTDPDRGMPMNRLLALTAVAALAGCGVETASTAATAAALKKQEVEQGQKTMQRAQEKIDGAMQQMQQRADSAADKQ